MPIRFVRYAAWAAVAAVIIMVAVVSVEWYGQQGATRTGVVDLGGEFSLTDSKGRRATEADLLGRPRAMFFGYTTCPDVCPTTLYEASGWLKQLGAEADKLRLVFVTVDPERDTPDVLDEYLSAFDPRIVGLTGTPEEVGAMLKAYRVYAQKVEVEGSDYLMDHSASIYLFDDKGEFAGSISHDEDAEAAVEKLRDLIS